MKTVGVLSEDRVLIRKIELILFGEYSVSQATEDERERYDICITDKDFFDVDGDVCLSRDPEKDECITIPFLHSEFIEAVRHAGAGARGGLSLGEGAAYYQGKKIKLTEVEYKLLAALLSRDSFISREDLLQAVWGGERDIGVVNVYIHYLREKLEQDGEKIIISSRREGYRIDERYRRDKGC